MIKRAVRYGGLIFLAVSLIVRLLFQVFPQLFEAVYFNGLFPVIRKIQYPVGKALPVSGYFLLILLAFLWTAWRLPKTKDNIKWAKFGRRLLNFCGGLAGLFLVLWGYNYVGAPLSERMSLPERDGQYDVAKLYLHAMREASEKRTFIKLAHDSAAVEDMDMVLDEKALNEAVRNVLSRYGYPTETDVYLRKVKPTGALRRVGIRGIYNPFTGEANVGGDAGILTGVFTAAHEMAHAYGITGEGEANLTAYLALIHSGNEVWEYAATYALWRYVAGEVNRKLEEEDRAELAKAIPLELQIDRLAVWRRVSDSPPYFPELSEAVNDSYLKIQGVKGGTDDYNAFVGLYLRYADPVMERS